MSVVEDEGGRREPSRDEEGPSSGSEEECAALRDFSWHRFWRNGLSPTLCCLKRVQEIIAPGEVSLHDAALVQ